MFLAKVWKTSNGKKYEAWVLKKGVWDKLSKRYRQVYLAYVGTTTEISLEKAEELCKKLGLTLGELKSVRRMKITGLEPAAAPGAQMPAGLPIQPVQPRVFSTPVASAAPAQIAAASQPSAAEPSAQTPRPIRPLQPLPNPADLIRKLREQFGLSRTPKGYEELAMRIGVLLASAKELRRAENSEGTLRAEQIRRMEELLHAPHRRTS